MISKNQIKRLKSLHRKKERDVAQLFFAEGVKLVAEILALKPEIIKELYSTSDFASSNHALLKAVNIDPIIVTDAELNQISLLTTPNNALAVCDYFNSTGPVFDFTKGFTFYLDDIRDPGNLGTIIRLADWYGIKKIFCSPSTVDFYSPKVIQATMGAFLRVDCVYESLEKIIGANNIKDVYGAVLNGKDIYSYSLKAGLIVIGNESNGISEQNLKYITQPLTIPAHNNNGTESLNAAIATSIIASEFYRSLNY